MASPSSAQASKPVSSRLLNMKFMQRPSPSKSTSSPTQSHPASPSSSKSKPHSPAVPESNRISREAILAAHNLELSRREAAINSTSLGASERWSLSIPSSERANEIRGGGEMIGGVRVFVAGNTAWEDNDHHVEDQSSDDDEEVQVAAPVRRYFGGRTAPVETKKSTHRDSDEESDSFDSDTSASESELLQRSERKRAAKALKKEQTADKALRNLTQFGGRGSTFNNNSDMECYGCGEKGHRRADCPNQKSRSNSQRSNRGSKPSRGGALKREHDSIREPRTKKQKLR